MIKKELETFESARVRDFKKTIIKYLESLLTHQNEVRMQLRFNMSLKYIVNYSKINA